MQWGSTEGLASSADPARTPSLGDRLGMAGSESGRTVGITFLPFEAKAEYSSIWEQI